MLAWSLWGDNKRSAPLSMNPAIDRLFFNSSASSFVN